MANQSFNQALKYVLIDEGGNDDDPNDHGGRTSRGITQKEYDAWCKLNSKPSGDVWKASKDDITSVYKTQYWDPYCDGLEPGVDYLFFDISVNAGRSRAIKTFQQALGVEADGMLGQITLSAITSSNKIDLIHSVSEVRRNFYRHLAQFPRYGKGWLSRCDHCEKGAIHMAGASVDTRPEIPASAESPKADENDVTKTSVTPETSGGTAVASGGLMSILDQFKDSLSNYSDTFIYIKYVLIGVAVIGLSYSVYGFYVRSKSQEAVI